MNLCKFNRHIPQIARQPDNSRSFDINMYFMHNYHTERAQNVFILGFPVPVYTPCVYRDLSYWQRSGRTFRVRARRSSTNFTPCSSTVRAVFTRRTSPRDLSNWQWSGGEHGTSSGGRSVFLGQFERGIRVTYWCTKINSSSILICDNFIMDIGV